MCVCDFKSKTKQTTRKKITKKKKAVAADHVFVVGYQGTMSRTVPRTRVKTKTFNKKEGGGGGAKREREER